MTCKSFLGLFVTAAFICNVKSLSNYEAYTDNGINSGLVPTPTGFVLNGEPIRVQSGAVHYFRVHPAYWRDRLKKVRAAGLNAVETYVPWNLHEPKSGSFDFGQGQNDMSQFLDLVTYIKMAQDEDLFVILRPGPYICSEWEFGGLPSWLQREPGMLVRTSTEPFMSLADRFFENLLPLVVDLQFTKGGPIIAFQVENEYGGFLRDDLPYLEHVKSTMERLGLVEMFFTSDGTITFGDRGAIPGVLQTSNFQTDALPNLNKLLELQPNLPAMVMEFWGGWFDHWSDNHNGLSIASFNRTLLELLNFPASVNFYMFHGGTNFGFMNGANAYDPAFYIPDVSSYDYDAPLTEAGDYTEKYMIIRDLMPRYAEILTSLPDMPAESVKTVYPDLTPDGFLSFAGLQSQVPSDLILTSSPLINMEALPINENNGQSYGYIVYKTIVDLAETSVLRIGGHIRDFAIVLVDGMQVTEPILTKEQLTTSFGTWVTPDSELTIRTGVKTGAVLEIIVENLGRINYGVLEDYDQKKGLVEGPITLDENELLSWEVTPLEFKTNWVTSLTSWSPLNDQAASTLMGPTTLRFILDIPEIPADTWLDMSSWGKGIALVNGFNLGRYWSMGPTKTLYVPAPLLKQGENVVIVFEQYRAADRLTFTDKPQLGFYTPA